MPRNLDFSALFGALEGIRIPDLPLRRRTLYPAELLGHIHPVLYPFLGLVSTSKAFPYGEGGTASAVTDEVKTKNFEKVGICVHFLFTL